MREATWTPMGCTYSFVNERGETVIVGVDVAPEGDRCIETEFVKRPDGVMAMVAFREVRRGPLAPPATTGATP